MVLGPDLCGPVLYSTAGVIAEYGAADLAWGGGGSDDAVAEDEAGDGDRAADCFVYVCTCVASRVDAVLLCKFDIWVVSGDYFAERLGA